jgi:hypothetical protein
MNVYRPFFPILTVLVLALRLVGCGSDDDDPPQPASYRVRLINLSANQPLSPMAVVLHGSGYSAWAVGDAASNSLELLAEGGDPAGWIAAADADPDVLATAQGAGVVTPGSTDAVEFSVSGGTPVHLTLAAMLVNTNDAFGGINGRILEDLAIGQSVTVMAPAYDAGSEANSESMATVPGPAAGGEGFNAARDDTDAVHVHPGVISSQDGLTGSALVGSHRWDNPVIKVAVTRTS